LFVVKTQNEQMFASVAPPWYRRHVQTPVRGWSVADNNLTERQLAILTVIEEHMRERGYPPSVREIGSAVGLTSTSTVHAHLGTLQRLGYLRRDPTKPRAIEVHYDVESGSTAERRPTRHVPLVGDVAAGTDVLAQENVDELWPLPSDLTGDGQLFMLRVRGDSMIDAGIFDGDYVVARQQSEARKGDVVVAGIPGDEATVKTYNGRKGSKITLLPSNPRLKPMELDAGDVTIYGKVVTVLRRL
jgi:repressor LexA